MIKILILFAIVILAAALGKILAADKKKRMKVFCEFYEFNEKLLLNLKYGKDKVGDVAKDFEYVKCALEGKKVLKDEDEQFIENYISNVGCSDAASQVDYLNERKVALKKYKDESSEHYKKYGSLYLKIALMVGVLIAVLLA